MAEIKRVIALGFFDGVHIGHGALLRKTKERSQQIGAVPTMVSFDVHPDNLVFGRETPLINSAADRKEIVERVFGINDVLLLHFDRELMCMPWQDFADKIIRELNVSWIVVGHDFCFGYKGQGTTQRLKEYCEEKGIGCDIIQPVMMDGQIVSSTYIRTLIENGDMEQANRYLGHPYSLSNTVCPGFQLGTKMGLPTINLFFEDGVIIPKHGVYATKVVMENGDSYTAATNVGVRPTVSDNNKANVESHILDFTGDLYGCKVRVDFHAFIRPEIKFNDVQALFEQMGKDSQTCRNYFLQA